MARSKAYLFSGVEIRWRCAPACLAPGDDTPEQASFHFPGGLSDYLAERLEGAQCYADRAFAAKVDFAERFGAGTVGSVEWAVNWTPQRDAFVSSYCNTIPTPEGGTHEAGFWAAILKGLRAHGELAGNRKAAQVTREDVTDGAQAMISVFIREPEFVGQTKDRLATQEAARLVETAVRDRFDHWLAADTRTAGAILDYLVLKAEERARRRAEKETQPQDRGEEAAPPRQARRLLRRHPRRLGALPRRGRLARAARRSRPATARPRPCCRSAARS